MPTSNVRNNTTNDNNNKDNKDKRALLNFNSQCGNLLGVTKVTKKTTMDEVKLATNDMCNNSAERADAVYVDNVLLTFVNETSTMKELN